MQIRPAHDENGPVHTLPVTLEPATNIRPALKLIGAVLQG